MILHSQSTPCQHPVVMLAGIGADDLESLLEFVYRGEVSVEPSQLPSLLQAAHCLCIHGLTPPTIVTEVYFFIHLSSLVLLFDRKVEYIIHFVSNISNCIYLEWRRSSCISDTNTEWWFVEGDTQLVQSTEAEEKEEEVVHILRKMALHQ